MVWRVTQLFQNDDLMCYRLGVEEGGSTGRDGLISTARQLFAEQGIEAVSLREVARAAGHRNTNAVQYHFGDRDALVTAVVEPLERDVGARRAALVDVLASEPVPSMRSIAGALVRPSAAMLEVPEGREHLRIVAELIVDMDRFNASTGDADNSLVDWDRLARSNMADTTLPLHRRYAAISLCFNELGRRAATRRRPDHRLFVSDLIDLVTGVLLADVSEETQHLLADRERQRSAKHPTTRKAKAST